MRLDQAGHDRAPGGVDDPAGALFARPVLLDPCSSRQPGVTDTTRSASMVTSPGAAGEPLPSNTRPLVKMMRSTVAPQQDCPATAFISRERLSNYLFPRVLPGRYPGVNRFHGPGKPDGCLAVSFTRILTCCRPGCRPRSAISSTSAAFPVTASPTRPTRPRRATGWPRTATAAWSLPYARGPARPRSSTLHGRPWSPRARRPGPADRRLHRAPGDDRPVAWSARGRRSRPAGAQAALLGR